MKILQVRPGTGGQRVATIDVELAPGVKAVDVTVFRKPDGSTRVFGSGVRFDRKAANELARAAIAAGGVRHDRA